MKLSSLLKSISAALFFVVVSEGHLLAEDVPKFSDPIVNTFVADYSKFVDDYAVAYKASKAGDQSKLQALQTKSQELQSEAATVASKVKPEEAQKFQAYISSVMQKLLDIPK
jgi:hypothetical protein